MLIDLDDGQLMIHIFIREGIIIAECEFIVRIDEKLIAALYHRQAFPLIGNRNGNIFFDLTCQFIGKRILLNHPVRCEVFQFGSAFPACIEVHGAIGELSVGMTLYFHPSFGRAQGFLLQNEGNGVLLFIGQGIVAAETLGDVDTLRLGVAAHLQHVLVEIAVDVAIIIARFVCNHEAVVGIVSLIIHVFPVQDLIRGGDHLEIVNGILAD